MASNSISILIDAKDNASATLAKVRGEISDTGNVAQDAEPKTDRFGSTLGTLASRIRFVAETFAIYKVAQSVTEFASASVNAAGQLEQTNVSFQNLIGNAKEASVLFGNLVQYANQTPFQVTDVTNAAKQLLAFGETAKDTTGLVKQLGDVSSAGGGDLQALALVTGQIFSQGKLRAQDLYQVINDGGAGLVKIMAKSAGGMQALTAEFDAGGIPAQQYFDAINTATSNGNFAFQGAQKQAETFNGRLSTLKDTALQFGEALIGVHTDPELGLQIEKGGLFDRLKSGIGGVTTVLGEWEPAVQRAVPQFLENLGKLADRVGHYLQPSFEALWHTLQDKVFPMLSRLWKEVIEPLLPVIGTALVVAVKGVVDILNALLQAITPVINFMLDHKQGVLDFAVAFGILAIAMKFDDIKSAFLSNMGEIMGSIGSVKSSVTDLFTKISGGSVMGGVAVAGALADIALVMQAIQSVHGALNALNQANNAKTKAAEGYSSAITDIVNQQKAGKISPAQAQKQIAPLLSGMDSLYKYASGTSFAPGGMALVGEQGPELVSLPRGSQVTPAGRTKQMMRGGVNIGEVHVHNEVDLNNLLSKIGWRLAVGT